VDRGIGPEYLEGAPDLQHLRLAQGRASRGELDHDFLELLLHRHELEHPEPGLQAVELPAHEKHAPVIGHHCAVAHGRDPRILPDKVVDLLSGGLRVDRTGHLRRVPTDADLDILRVGGNGRLDPPADSVGAPGIPDPGISPPGCAGDKRGQQQRAGNLDFQQRPAAFRRCRRICPFNELHEGPLDAGEPVHRAVKIFQGTAVDRVDPAHQRIRVL